MGTWNNNLIGVAYDIANSKSNRLIVMAGPGTGKSYALKRRILRLIEEEGVAPEKILALTFTRTIAEDLKKELHDLGIENAKAIKAMTLHAFCFGMLKKRRVFDILRRIPRPIKSFNSKGAPQFELSPLLADLEGNFGNKREKFKKIKAFEAAWARNQQDIPNYATNDDIVFKNALIEWLKKHNAMLLGEVVPLMLQFLENNPSDNVFNEFSHIVVDEYQDLNKAEQILIDQLGRNCKISVVGDIDQSIYGFRYAHFNGITDFAERHIEQCEKFTIEDCRRCSKKIIAAANSLILHNHSDSIERLRALPESIDGTVRAVQWETAEKEVEGIADFIKHLLNKHYSLSDILILSPRRLFAYKIKEKLQQQDIPVHSFFHEEAIESPFSQKSITLLNLLINKDDNVALRFWLGLGSQTWNARQYKILSDAAKDENISVRELLDGLICGKFNIKIPKIKLAYENLLFTLAALKSKTLIEIIDELFPKGNDDVKILREACLFFLEKGESPASLEGLWAYLEAIITQPETPETGDYIRIMSLHKSKGLTSKVTIILNCVEGFIPIRGKHGAHDEDALLKEQRRLFYVAMTRAKEYLVISSFAKVDVCLGHQTRIEMTNKRGKFAKTIASQFITESQLKSISGDEWRSSNFD